MIEFILFVLWWSFVGGCLGLVGYFIFGGWNNHHKEDE